MEEVFEDMLVLGWGWLGMFGVIDERERDLQARTGVEKADVANAVEAVFQGCKGRALREEHENSIKAFVEVWVFLWLEELEPKV